MFNINRNISCSKKRAFTLFELILTLSILLIIFKISFISLENFKNRNALNTLENKLPDFFYTAADLSYRQNTKFDIDIDFDSKLIFVKKDDIILMKFKLPSDFDYEDSYGNKLIRRNTTETGNINMSFSIYSFDKHGSAVFKETFLNNKKFIRYLVINKYIPKENISKGEHKIYKNWERIE